MMSLEELDRPIPFGAIAESLSSRLRSSWRRVAERGGILPPKTLSAVVAVLSEMDATLGSKLSRMSTSRRELIAALGKREKENLAVQKETLTAALMIAGVETREVLDWTPATIERRSFLDGLPGARVREDVMLHADLASLPGFAAIRDAPHIATRTFASEQDPAVRVTVVMANRLPLEEQTGADLIYFNETYRSFVLVQYKALEKVANQHEFRWSDGDLFSAEISRMDRILEELEKIEPEDDPDGFRFSSNPFFLKFCSRIVFNPDDRGLFPGMYLPLGLWKALAQSGRLKGPRSGNLLTYSNVGRRLSGADFILLVAGSWVGTTINQSASLEVMIRAVLEGGRTVTFAVKHRKPPEPEAESATLPQLDEGEAVAPSDLERVRLTN